MRSRSAMSAVVVLAVAGAVLASVPAAALAEPATVDLIVALTPASSSAPVVAAGSVVEQERLSADLVSVAVPAAQAEQAAAALSRQPGVAYVEADATARIVATPTDPALGQQWGSWLTGLPQAWEAGTGSADVVIAVIDTGVNSAHPDLAGVSYVPGRDFVNGDEDPGDDHGHGTAAVGVIAAQHNSLGTAGVCPRCTIMPLKSMAADGTGTHSAIAAAINYAVDHGADIINLSLGSEATTTTLQNAVRRADDAGVLVIAAAGNAGVSTPFHPAAYPEVVGVAASDPGDARYSWSNHGSWVTLSAPGCNLAPRFLPGTGALDTAVFCGTSSAAPLVAGVAGLLGAASPALDGRALATAMQTTAVAVPFVATGRVQAAAALSSLAPPPNGGGGGGGGGAVLPPDDTQPAGEEQEPAAPTALEITTSAAAVRHGQSVEIGGRVVSSGDPEGVTVTLQDHSGADWADVAEQAADGAGDVRFSVEPEGTADYRLLVADDSGQAPATSDVLTIAVRPVVTGVADPRAVAGRRFRVTGDVTPSRDAADVTLQRRTSDGWRTVAAGTTGEDGAYALAAKAAVGARRYRVRFDGTPDLEAEVSPVFRVIGERVRIPRARPDARGDDRRNLNGEVIVLRNTGRTAVTLDGWTLRARRAGRTFTLPEYRLAPGARVVVHSGRGQSRRGHVYLGSRREVWHNRRDVAVLRHPTGAVAARRIWR